MGRCFVMQPFDRGVFDKRYDDVFTPAIQDAGLEPYRVDRDPSVSIPIDEIESEEGIQAKDLLVSFLLSFAGRPATRERLHLFTTNYDRLIEYGCDILGFAEFLKPKKCLATREVQVKMRYVQRLY